MTSYCKFKMLASEISSRLIPEKNLIQAVFLQGLKDAFFGEHQSIRREARFWLLSEKNEVHTAVWWTEQYDLQNLLRLCREILASDNAEYVKRVNIW